MAALWPTRYPAGWVSVTGFAQAGVLLGERLDRESLKAAIRRGLRQLDLIPLAPQIECCRTQERDPVSDRPRRERARRLAEAVCPEFQLWLLQEGPRLIVPSLWCRFLPLHPVAADEPLALRRVLRQALGQAESCLSFAAHLVPNRSPEGRLLLRLQRRIQEGLRGLE